MPISEPVRGSITLYYHGNDWRNLEPVQMPFIVYPNKALSALTGNNNDELFCSITRDENGSFLYINSRKAQKVDITLYDALGKTHSLQSLYLMQGGQKIGLTNHGLSSGIYIASIKTETSTIIRKVIKSE